MCVYIVIIFNSAILNPRVSLFYSDMNILVFISHVTFTGPPGYHRTADESRQVYISRGALRGVEAACRLNNMLLRGQEAARTLYAFCYLTQIFFFFLFFTFFGLRTKYTK